MAEPRRSFCSALAAAALALMGCTSEGPRAAPGTRDHEAPKPPARVDSPPANARATADTSPPPPAASPATPKPPEIARERYPWLADTSAKPPEPVEPLEARFAPPPGYKRVPLEKGSFGEWLRGLPLAAPGTPVLSYQGGVILPDGHENLAAVVAIDIGAADLQQCADSVVRMHAEWRWSNGARDMTYRAASGAQMPFSKWARGERPTENSGSITWTPRARPDPEGGVHPSFRKYLDNVFMWANTGALAVQGTKIPKADIRPGDFVVLPGNPGHAVLILDIAQSDKGDRVALLGQGFMPAQNFQVLRPNRSQTWFPLDLDSPGLKTPFWPTFPWDSLRRLDAP